MVEYRRLAPEDVEAVSDLQRRVFGFSDLDLLPGPLLRLVARDNPPVGLNVGAFVPDSQRLAGAILSFATFEPNAVYAVALGVYPEYQGLGIGLGLLRAFRDHALARGLATMYGVFDALNPQLGRLYAGGVGFVGTELVGTSLLFRWDLESEHVRYKLANHGHARTAQPGEVLLPFPNDQGQREETLSTIRKYLEQKYTVVDCVTSSSNEERLTSYVLRPSS